ncbi:calcium/proton exchanger, partial [Piedraia hortae CBS 480.64]
RKRKSRKFLPWKKDETGADMERTNTSLSQKKKFPKLSIMSQIRAVFGSWINIMLVFVPVGIALEYAHVNKILVFIMNFLAIIPLAAMLSYATEELAMYIGETLGGLLNATFGNAVELIVSIIALTQGKILIVQTSLIGSMLSNLLLVLGMCFYFGGMRREEQYFNLTVAQTASSLLSLAIGSLIIPTAFVSFANVDKGATPASRGTAVMLLFVYGAYLIFQLHTHATMYNEPSRKSPKKPSNRRGVGEMTRSLAHMGAGTGSAKAHEAEKQAERPKEDEAANQEDQEEEETPQLTVLGAIITLAGSTVLIALCAEYMVSSINEVAKSVSPEFIGLILLPIVGNAAEHATAVTVAIKDKMDLAIGVAVGSSLQIALLVLPFMVCLNWWGVGSPAVLSLSFDGFQVCVLFIAVILVNYVINDGKSHWLEGIMLTITYMIIAVSAWFYPASGDVAG